jgi:hypothetical protein
MFLHLYLENVFGYSIFPKLWQTGVFDKNSTGQIFFDFVAFYKRCSLTGCKDSTSLILFDAIIFDDTL